VQFAAMRIWPLSDQRDRGAIWLLASRSGSLLPTERDGRDG